MRTLLVDNYDSFTYNLAEYLTEVNGEPPTIVHNDSATFHPRDVLRFDNVVVSPGPGHPAVPRDVGMTAEIIRQAGRPILGVCLGHQTIAQVFGATVARAPEPRHGRLSQVRHDGTGLFAGLPDPLTVVRYHSLAVTDLPEDLEPLAHSEDGVLMALRHRSLPLWGVQFHPESICSDGGKDLLRRFMGLSREWNATHGGAVEPVPVPGTTRAETSTGTVLAQTLPLPAGTDPEHLFDTLFRPGPHAFWLDSSLAGPPMGRFSVMGDGSGPRARTVRADVTSRTVTVTDASGARTTAGSFFDWLEADLRAHRAEVVVVPGPDGSTAAPACDFALGWVGYLGYELKAECDGAAAHRSPHPDAQLVFPERAVVIDHRANTATLLVLGDAPEDDAPTGPPAGAAGAGSRDDAHARLDRLRAEVLTAAASAGPADPDPEPGGPVGALKLRHDKDAYLALIGDCHAEIDAGESYEICLTNEVTSAHRPEPWPAYRRMRRISPAPYGAYLDFGGVAVLSTSPERFLTIDRTGRVESKPIKGTRPRGQDQVQDDALRADLVGHEKDRAENLMIVDLVRHDLTRTALPGTVEVSKLFDVESYRTVHQLVSTVAAQLDPQAGAVACVRAAFPPGSMTGAPKRRTMEIIDRLEEGPRGVYSGALGYFSLTGAADLSVVIRTLVIDGDGLRYGVGGAIVALSDPEDEYEETAVKAASLLRLLGATFPSRQQRRAPGAPAAAGASAPRA